MIKISCSDFPSLASYSLALLGDEEQDEIIRPPAHFGHLMRYMADKELRRGKGNRTFTDEFTPRKVHIGRFQNAQVHGPRCVVRTVEGHLLEDSLTALDEDSGIAEGERFAGHSERAARGFVLGAPLSGNYYHWMALKLPTLGYLPKAAEGRCKIVMGEPNAWQMRTLELAGYSTDDIDVVGPGETRSYETLFYPYGFGSPRDPSSGIGAFYGRLKQNAKLSGGEDILLYVSRRDAPRRRRPLRNAQELEAALERLGFAIICPGEMTVDEQIDVFHRARMVVAPHGAGLCNLHFCRPGTLVYELFPYQRARPGYFRIAQYVGLPYFADCFKNNEDGSWKADSYRVLDQVERCLKLLDEPTAVEASRG